MIKELETEEMVLPRCILRNLTKNGCVQCEKKKKRLESIIKCGGGECTGYPPKGVETLFWALCSATDRGDGTAGHQLQACSPAFRLKFQQSYLVSLTLVLPRLPREC